MIIIIIYWPEVDRGTVREQIDKKKSKRFKSFCEANKKLYE